LVGIKASAIAFLKGKTNTRGSFLKAFNRNTASDNGAIA
jgi:hypothetical protein